MADSYPQPSSHTPPDFRPAGNVRAEPWLDCRAPQRPRGGDQYAVQTGSMHLALLRALGGPSHHADVPVLLARLAREGTWHAPRDMARRLHEWLGIAGPGGDGASGEPYLDIAGTRRATESGLDRYVMLAVREIAA